MEIDAIMLMGKYSDDPDYDMQYEPTLDPEYRVKNQLILMTKGECNFKCQFCFFHNVNFLKQPNITLEEIEAKIPEADMVMIAGAEPTRYDYLPEVMRAIKRHNIPLHLHANGSDPDMLELIVNEGLVDFIAMDIKAPPEKYELVTGVNVDTDKIKRSIDIVKRLPEYKFRTTICRELLNKGDIVKIAKWIGGGYWYELRGYWDSPIGRGHGRLSAYSTKDMQAFVKAIAKDFKKATLLEGRRGLGGT